MPEFSFKNTTVEEIKEYFNKVHQNFFDYSLFKEYKNSEYPIEIICPIHGVFKQSCYIHSKGHSCGKCSRQKSESLKYEGYKNDFLKRIEDKHKGNITITGEYVNNGTLIKYKCNSCGIEYTNTPNKLLNKKSVGCAYCYGNGKHKQHLAYFEKYKPLLVEEIGFVYIVRLTNNFEDFIKIGVTKEESCKGRFSKIPYEKEILLIEENNMYNCFKIEQRMLKEYKKYSYRPKIWFGGGTECLLLDCFNDVQAEVRLMMAEVRGHI